MPLNYDAEILNRTIANAGCENVDLLKPFGIVVQLLMVIIAFTCLLVKRHLEPAKQRRSLKIWLFDISKQFIAASVVHLCNILFAMSASGDPCVWYIVSFLLDSTIGLLIVYLQLRLLDCLASRYDWKSLHMGDYGEPASGRCWALQCSVYVGVAMGEKCIVVALLLFDFWKPVAAALTWPLSYASAQVEMVFVLLIIPLAVNALWFWVVDNFLKRHTWSDLLGRPFWPSPAAQPPPARWPRTHPAAHPDDAAEPLIDAS